MRPTHRPARLARAETDAAWQAVRQTAAPPTTPAPATISSTDEALAARDRAFYDFVNAVGGYEPLVELVQQHGQAAGVELANDEALMMIEGWRQSGVVRNMSIGEYLDEAWSGVDESE